MMSIGGTGASIANPRMGMMPNPMMNMRGGNPQAMMQNNDGYLPVWYNCQ
jgi:hypothetical protein